MKKFNFWKLASLIFVCALLVSTLAITMMAADEVVDEPADEPVVTDTTVEIVSNNVFYGSTYQIMYAIKAPVKPTVTAVDSEGNAVAVVEFAEEPTATVNGEECFIFVTKGGVAAQALDEVITVTATAGEESATQSYSVLQYVYERLYVKNVAVDAERAMFEALLTYADAANAFIDGETVSFKDYVYVTVVDGTLSNDTVAGMFLPETTPFANIATTLNCDAATHHVMWDVVVGEAEAVRYTNAQMKALAVADEAMTVTAVVAEHAWKDATCTAPKTCEACGATEGATLAHNYVEGKCEDCGKTDPNYYAPMTIAQAKATADGKKVLLEGTVATIDTAYNSTYKNITVTIVDANGDKIQLYRLSGNYKVHDVIKVKGVLDTYNGVRQLAAGATAELLGTSEHNYTDATCIAPKTCKVCGVTDGDALEHTYVDGECSECGFVQPTGELVTVTKTHTEIAKIAGVTAGQNTGVVSNKQIKLDDNITVVFAKGSASSDPCIYAESVRLYQNGATMTIKAAEGRTIKSVKITLASKSGGQGPIAVTGGTASALQNLVYTITAGEDASQIVVTTKGTDKNNRLYVASIEVVYE